MLASVASPRTSLAVGTLAASRQAVWGDRSTTVTSSPADTNALASKPNPAVRSTSRAAPEAAMICARRRAMTGRVACSRPSRVRNRAPSMPYLAEARVLRLAWVRAAAHWSGERLGNARRRTAAVARVPGAPSAGELRSWARSITGTANGPVSHRRMPSSVTLALSRAGRLARPQ